VRLNVAVGESPIITPGVGEGDDERRSLGMLKLDPDGIAAGRGRGHRRYATGAESIPGRLEFREDGVDHVVGGRAFGLGNRGHESVLSSFSNGRPERKELTVTHEKSLGKHGQLAEQLVEVPLDPLLAGGT
jgi:hypothetical protein